MYILYLNVAGKKQGNYWAARKMNLCVMIGAVYLMNSCVMEKMTVLVDLMKIKIHALHKVSQIIDLSLHHYCLFKVSVIFATAQCSSVITKASFVSAALS